MIEWDSWGVPDNYECEVIENDAPIPQHRPGPLPEKFYKPLKAVNSESKTEIPAASSSEPQVKEEVDSSVALYVLVKSQSPSHLLAHFLCSVWILIIIS
ncbi:hypothetical protein ISN45_Aa07g013270 [Arabidopsis thaliana x Arabidopsis arenosa]|uniref:Uncharacterized protein n=1 Tax=Arabidopsis thaliana x Arabidopsis arenosa TaxID=1240361 RepID=A0A8T1Y9F2_9BRAS|nr:hypothetical protein ISN45_Aa07g013270 [Arabidopsis thaliana x Arabidopsis arenosa]